MKIIRYKESFKDECLRVFKSNIGTFFAPHETKGYESYLGLFALKLPYFIVMKSNEVVACGGYAEAGGMATLSWGMVDYDHHGKSIGKHLLVYRLNAIASDFGNIPLTIDTSQQARGFYEKHGFKIIEVVPNGYGDGFDKVFMEYSGGFV